MSNATGDTTTNENMAETLLAGLQAGATVGDMRGISGDMLEGVYAYAYRFYESGQIDKAEVFFRFLYLYDFYNGEYALGLAAVYQMKREYQKAIDMYAVAFALTKNDYRPMFHVGQCQLALKKLALAKDCFESVLEKSEDESLVARARTYLDAMVETDANASA
jgi:type III secretion system low calcium response chaperone LcrH/SycD